MAKLTRQQATALLLDGVRLDVQDGAAVHGLLERQFEAAVRHRTAGGMDHFFATLEAGVRADAQAAWQELEAIVTLCKQATGRNAGLLAEQYSVMQRVLHGEEAIYAPR